MKIFKSLVVVMISIACSLFIGVLLFNLVQMFTVQKQPLLNARVDKVSTSRYVVRGHLENNDEVSANLNSRNPIIPKTIYVSKIKMFIKTNAFVSENDVMSTIYAALGCLLIFGFLDLLVITSIIDDFKEYKSILKHQNINVSFG